MTYDSAKDTHLHITTVRANLMLVTRDLIHRASDHDKSKLAEPEKSMFDRYTPLLRETEYDSPEYHRHLAEMGKALQHHYEVNDHHPEHFQGGVADMNLMQLIEMLADWAAAVKRHPDGDLGESIRKNAVRFGYGKDMELLLTRTARDLGWL